MGRAAPSTELLTFDEESHTYRINGVVVPSVTQVLDGAGFIDKQWFTDEARQRGTYVAQATQFDDEGTLDFEALDDGLRGYVEAWRKFKREAGFTKILFIEQRVCDPELAYAGTLDRLLRWGHPSYPWVLDIKTGAKAAWHCLQTAAYAGCLPGVASGYRRGSVILKEDGTYKFIKHSDWNDWRVFQAALSIYHWKSEKVLR